MPVTPGRFDSPLVEAMNVKLPFSVVLTCSALLLAPFSTAQLGSGGFGGGLGGGSESGNSGSGNSGSGLSGSGQSGLGQSGSSDSGSGRFQRGTPAPLPGLPATAPPVDHPALGAQPLMGENGGSKSGGSSGEKGDKKPAPKIKPPVAGTVGPVKDGKDLAKAVAKVKSMKWCNSLGDAKARSAATGKPILLLQALGDLEGFA